MLKRTLSYVLASVIGLTLIGGGLISSLAFRPAFRPGDSGSGSGDFRGNRP